MSQVNDLIGYMQNHEYITQLIARQVFGIERLASRITDIKKKGFIVSKETRRTVTGQRYTRYYLN